MLPVVQQAPYPGRLDQQRGRAGAENGDDQGADAVRHQPRGDALPGPGGRCLVGVPGTWQRRPARRPAASGAPNSRTQARATSPARASVTVRMSVQPRRGHVLGEPERVHRVHRRAQHQARAGADGQRGGGHRGAPAVSARMAARQQAVRIRTAPHRQRGDRRPRCPGTQTSEDWKVCRSMPPRGTAPRNSSMAALAGIRAKIAA